MTPEERRDAIVRLLRTRDDHLPEPVHRTEASRGFVHSDPDNTEACPDCLANDRVMFGCETCGGAGRVAAPRSRDPYAKDVVVAYGLDGSRHEATRARDRQIEILGQQLRPASTVDEIEDANRHPYGWELARRRKWGLFDYATLDRALDLLMVADAAAATAVEKLHVHRRIWPEPAGSPTARRQPWHIEPIGEMAAALERGLVFIDERMPGGALAALDAEGKPRKLRAPGVEPEVRIVARVQRSAGDRARELRDVEIRRAVLDARLPTADVARTWSLSVSQVNKIVRSAAAA